MVWKPSVTVAAVIERDGRFLLVEERIDGRLVLNQPAGHLEVQELLQRAHHESGQGTLAARPGSPWLGDPVAHDSGEVRGSRVAGEVARARWRAALASR